MLWTITNRNVFISINKITPSAILAPLQRPEIDICPNSTSINANKTPDCDFLLPRVLFITAKSINLILAYFATYEGGKKDSSGEVPFPSVSFRKHVVLSFVCFSRKVQTYRFGSAVGFRILVLWKLSCFVKYLFLNENRLKRWWRQNVTCKHY